MERNLNKMTYFYVLG